MAKEWCAIAALLATSAPLATNAASCGLIRSSALDASDLAIRRSRAARMSAGYDWTGKQRMSVDEDAMPADGTLAARSSARISAHPASRTARYKLRHLLCLRKRSHRINAGGPMHARIIAAALIAMASSSAIAQDYPIRSIRMIVPL